MVHGWPNQEWFPELLDLMINFPLARSLVQNLLRQTLILTTLPPTFMDSQPRRLEVITGFHKEGCFFLKWLLNASLYLRGIRITTPLGPPPPPPDAYPHP